MKKSDLLEIKRLIEKHPILNHMSGDYAELENENDPFGLVVLKRATGHPYAWMPRDVWDSLMGFELSVK
jgi:hypothetical protein